MRAKWLTPGLDLGIVRDIAETYHLASTEPEGVTYAEVDFAGDSRKANPWAADLCDRARARGHDHPHAVRILARAWLFGIWHCWQDHTAYDPARHHALQRLLNQDQPEAA